MSTSADCSPIEPKIRLMDMSLVRSCVLGEATAGIPPMGTPTIEDIVQ